MNNPQHTPGPWTVEANELLGRDIVSRRAMAVVAFQVSESDAALIAAAPDLLRCLLRLYRLNRGLDSWHEDAWGDAWVDACSAIAKAEGRA